MLYVVRRYTSFNEIVASGVESANDKYHDPSATKDGVPKVKVRDFAATSLTGSVEFGPWLSQFHPRGKNVAQGRLQALCDWPVDPTRRACLTPRFDFRHCVLLGGGPLQHPPDLWLQGHHLHGVADPAAGWRTQTPPLAV